MVYYPTVSLPFRSRLSSYRGLGFRVPNGLTTRDYDRTRDPSLTVLRNPSPPPIPRSVYWGDRCYFSPKRPVMSDSRPLPFSRPFHDSPGSTPT